MFSPKKNDLFALCGPAGLLLVTYILIFLRQYLWFSDSILTSWGIPLVLSICLSVLIRRRFSYEVPGIQFNLIVTLPLLFFFSLRVAYPDFSWDIVNYHFINSERALNGFPFIEGDFLYLSYSNPASDMITGVFRHLMGHRLGTVVNLLALLWSAQVLDKILTHYLKDRTMRYLVVSVLLCFEGFTYQISNYWVDLLSMPIILELTYFLAFKRNKVTLDYSIIALLFGMALGLKLTNLYFLLPIALMLFVQFWVTNAYSLWKKCVHLFLLTAIFIAPLIPYHLYMFLLTGNPIYPHFNLYFQSDLFLMNLPHDPTLGPRTTAQSLVWPLVMLLDSGRLSPTPVWPILTFIAYILAICVLLTSVKFKEWTSRNTKIVSTLVLSSAFLWGFVSGDYRYVYVLEALAGLLIIMFALDVYQKLFADKYQTNRSGPFRHILMASLGLVFIVKFVATLDKAVRFEWAGRPTFFHNFEEYIENLAYIFNDYSLLEFVSDQERASFISTKAWISSSPVVSGYMALLNGNIPYVDLHHLPFRGTRGSQLLQETILNQKPVIYSSLIREGLLGHDLSDSIEDLIAQGFEPLGVRRFILPFYSYTPTNQIELTVLETAHKSHLNKLKDNLTEREIKQKKSTLVVVEWLEGCSGLERHYHDRWRWCSDNFSVKLKNYSDIQLEVTVAFDVASTSDTTSKFLALNDKFSSEREITNRPTRISENVRVLGGESVVLGFQTDAPRLNVPQDPRKLHVRLTGFSLNSSPVQR